MNAGSVGLNRIGPPIGGFMSKSLGHGLAKNFVMVNPCVRVVVQRNL